LSQRDLKKGSVKVERVNPIAGTTAFSYSVVQGKFLFSNGIISLSIVFFCNNITSTISDKLKWPHEFVGPVFSSNFYYFLGWHIINKGFRKNFQNLKFIVLIYNF